jgi:hypothetical protein
MEMTTSRTGLNESVFRISLDVVDLLGRLGTTRRIQWITESEGERAESVDLSDDSRQLGDARQSGPPPDLVGAEIDLDLFVSIPDEVDDRTLLNAGYILVEFDHDLGTSGSIYLMLSLGTDIYAPTVTRAPHDNRELADLNAPRVNRFLRSVEQHFGVPFTHLECQDYEGQIVHDGFVGY